MNQSDYSDFVMNHLRVTHPEFLATVAYNEDRSFVCHIESPRRTLSLWLKTWGKLITLELVLKEGVAWHTHMNLVGQKEVLTPQEEVVELTNYLRSVYAGEAPIVFGMDGEIYISDDQEQDFKMLRTGQILNINAWHAL